MGSKTNSRNIVKIAKEKEQQEEIKKLKQNLERIKRQRDAALSVSKELELIVRDSLVSKFKIPTQKLIKTRTNKKTFLRVAFGDTHGASIDIPAWKAFLKDIEELKPNEIIHGGDFVDCGGWLAEHHTLSYVPETEYSYFDDISAANQMLDQLQQTCPTAKIHIIQGNHDARIEKWCIHETRKHRVDAETLTNLLSPESLTNLKKRKINFYRRDTHYHGLDANKGSIKLGKCCFTHPQKTGGKHAAAKMAESWGVNVVYFHTHRRDSFTSNNAKAEEWGAWNPGCMCELRPYFHHSDNWKHSHGYHLQMVKSDGTFLPINVPIIEGKSYLSDFLTAIK